MYYFYVLILVFVYHTAETTLAVTPPAPSEVASVASFQNINKKSLEALAKARSEARLRRLKNTLGLQLSRHGSYHRILQKIRLEVEK